MITIKRNIENIAIRRLLWEKKNPYYILGVVILFILGLFLAKSFTGETFLKIWTPLYIIIGWFAYYVFFKVCKNLAKDIPKEELENKKIEIEQSFIHKVTTGRLRVFRTIIIAVIVFIVMLGGIILFAFIS